MIPPSAVELCRKRPGLGLLIEARGDAAISNATVMRVTMPKLMSVTPTNPARQMEHFLNPSDLSQVSVLDRTCRKCL